MRKLVLFVLLASLLSFAKDRPWQTGKLVKLDIQAVDGSTGMFAHADAYGNVYGRANASTDIDYYATVSDGKFSYFAGRKLYGGANMPMLTENAPIKFVIEKDTLILQDDNGKEFKMRLAKKTALP